MSEEARTYSIYKLGATTDLDTVTALKKMSRGEYFERLGEFADTAVALIKVIKTEEMDVTSNACSEALEKLQTMTLGIGSSSLIWKMAKLISSLHWGKKDAMAEGMMVVQKSVDALCAQIRDAEVLKSSASDEESKTAAPSETGDQNAVTPVRADPPRSELLQRAPVNPEIFEKTFLLVENQEYSHALLDLAVLRAFSYQEEIDIRLAKLMTALQNRQYETAQTEVGLLRNLVASVAERSNETGRKKQILAIDDVPDILRILQTGLRDCFDVIGVTNHITALKYLSTHTADLILLDIEMPDMDGFTLLDIIRKLENYKTTPVLFLTANASTQHVKAAIEHGGNDFIRKPVDLPLLIEKITKHLQLE